MPTKPILFQKIILLKLSLTLLTCTTPVTPEYQFIDGLIYIEGFVGTTEGSSYVTITESDVAVYYRNIFVSGANVVFINADSEERIPLLEENSQYSPPPNFKGELGENWFLEVNLPNGNQYLSEMETINPSVPIKEINIRYDKQLEFVEDYKKYVPGHEISVTFDDPENQTNYYYWRLKTYDKAQICKICYEGNFRDNNYIRNPNIDYYTYWCESDCWQIDYGNKIHIFSDKFSNGTTTSSLPIANVLLTRTTNVLVEIQQFSLTPKAYEYYRTIKDLIDNNGGFNAPLPAALIGNMYNPENPNEYVLGRFTASSANTKSIMIDRTMIEESPIDNQLIPHPEPPPSGPGPHYLYAPCEESRYRTSTEPEGWIE
ncbi:DUF4249 domain-containing protein [Confluentibacter flavum]|uniref:DUF4249 domain-containing protein n=1 Tax=Confluentibacter flavum TaxID=1909700 RepID=A0A2N3HJD7_9FLAO|nr:DUF4249 domain-containing protein [Confluentibacter flavum]PKQ45089.1 hypothetical protein CSW08_09940 [Confluentibacter flavum]